MTDRNGLRLPARAWSALRHFMRTEAAGGVLLILVAVLAVLLANSPLAAFYFNALHVELFGLTFAHWINDGLMALFFLLVGLEIKREILVGQLDSWGRRALPGFAALGGMIAPALIYVACNIDSAQTLRGWAIPAATDIAFALGVLALLGARVPASLKVFLTALAILDDLGAVVIIAIFYTADVSWLMLGAALAGVGLLVLFNRAGVTRLAPYLVIGVAVWFLVLKSGIHATLAGVAVALTIPLRRPGGDAKYPGAPLLRLEHVLHPYVAFLIVPVFGFANAGVSLQGVSLATLFDPVPLGIAAGLFIGKQLGVVVTTYAAIRLKLAQMPAGAGWPQFYGVAILCGIGFTMSLFIGALAFPDDPALIDQTRIGVLSGSLLSMVVGWLLLRLLPPSRQSEKRPHPVQ